jgi:hypothetical protein
MDDYRRRFDAALVDTFVLARAGRGATFTEELLRMLAAIDVDWDERLVRGRIEVLERARLLEREGTTLRLSDAGRHALTRALERIEDVLDGAGVLHAVPGHGPPGVAAHGGAV